MIQTVSSDPLKPGMPPGGETDGARAELAAYRPRDAIEADLALLARGLRSAFVDACRRCTQSEATDALAIANHRMIAALARELRVTITTLERRQSKRLETPDPASNQPIATPRAAVRPSDADGSAAPDTESRSAGIPAPSDTASLHAPAVVAAEAPGPRETSDPPPQATRTAAGGPLGGSSASTRFDPDRAGSLSRQPPTRHTLPYDARAGLGTHYAHDGLGADFIGPRAWGAAKRSPESAKPNRAQRRHPNES